MAGFDRDEFWTKILEMYPSARENNYILKLNEEQVKELLDLYIEKYIPEENLPHYDEKTLMKKMMTTIVSIYKLDKDMASNYSELIELVSSANYDGRNLYLRFAKISRLKCEELRLASRRSRLRSVWGIRYRR